MRRSEALQGDGGFAKGRTFRMAIDASQRDRRSARRLMFYRGTGISLRRSYQDEKTQGLFGFAFFPFKPSCCHGAVSRLIISAFPMPYFHTVFHDIFTSFFSAVFSLKPLIDT